MDQVRGGLADTVLEEETQPAEQEMGGMPGIPGMQPQAPQGPAFEMPTQENFANNPECMAQFYKDIYPVIHWTRQNRTSLEDEWRAIHRMEMLIHDEGRSYNGRSKAYLPLHTQNSQTLVSQLTRGLFPSDDYMDVMDRRPGMEERAKKVKTYLEWEMERVAKVKVHIKSFCKQLMDLGSSVIKVWYYKPGVTAPQGRKEGRLSQSQLADMLSPQAPQASFKAIGNMEGLRVSTRSIFNWYLYPTSAASIDEATIVFEDIPVSRGEIKERVRQGKWLNEHAALSAPVPSNFQVTQTEQHSTPFGLTPPVTPMTANTNIGHILVVTEVYTYMRLPESAYMQDEDPLDLVPVKLTIADKTMLELRRNPYFHQRPPYLAHSINTKPGLWYGYGAGRKVRSLQYLANDFANQTNDCAQYSLNPINKVNPGLVSKMRPLAPGVTWEMMDINEGQKFERPPVELIQDGLMMLNATVGMVRDSGGAPPVIQGVGAGGGAKTATGTQILQRNAMTPLQDVVEDVELNVMVPLMHMVWLLAQQYRDEAVMIAIAGESVKVSPEDLIIDPEFRWMASNQAQNQAQRAAASQQFMAALMPAIPYLQSIGYKVDPTPVLAKIWGDGLGNRGFDAIVRPLTPQETAQMAMAQMQAQGGGQGGAPGEAQSGGDRPRSATEQAGDGQQVETQPGESEDFMQVRQGADDMAGMMGGSYGGT